MTDSDALLHETNRAAHRVARAALQLRAHEGLLKFLPRKEIDAGVSLAYKCRINLDTALDEYEEAERRAQSEATR